VHDTVDLLGEAVGFGELTDGEARGIASAIRGCGRYLRRTHPDPLPRAYFAA
jgi:hypothetical protein